MGIIESYFKFMRLFKFRELRLQLEKSGVYVINNSESNYPFEGRVGEWRIFAEDENPGGKQYWIAQTDYLSNKDLPLEEATKMHFKEYPESSSAKLYGQVVRANGYPGGIEPRLIALPEASSFDGQSTSKMIAICNESEINAQRYVNLYHIDTELGLQEFVRVVKSLQN